MTAEARQVAAEGFSLIVAGRPREGMARLIRSYRLEPKQPDVLLTIGHLQQMGGQVVEAEPFFSAAVNLEPNRPYGHAKLGRIAAWRGEWEEAITHYRHALATAQAPPPPSFVEAKIESVDVTCVMTYQWLIKILGENDRFIEMEHAIEEALSCYPMVLPIQRQAFESRLTAGRIDKAREHLDKLATFGRPPEEQEEFHRYSLLCGWMGETLRQTVPAVAADYAKEDRRKDGKPPLVIAVAVWGESYVKGFLDYYLRTMAAPGNLPALAEAFEVRFALVTTASGREQIQRSGVEGRMTGIARFDYFLMPDDLVAKTSHAYNTVFIYRLYIMAMHVAIAYAQEIDAGITFSIPDAIVADGSFGYVAKMAMADSIEGVFAQAPTVAETGLLADVDRMTPAAGEPIVLSARDLMALGANHLHPNLTLRLLSPSNTDFSDSKSILYWWTPEGLVAHTFHWHPVYVSAARLARYRVFRYVSIDAILPQLLFPEPKDRDAIHLVTDSDTFGFLGTIQDDRDMPSSGRPFSEKDFTLYYRHSEQVRDLGRWFFRHRIRYSGFVPPDLDPADMTYDPALVARLSGAEPILGD